ncbi:hypothetical protein [Breoghania corrubedonensis]|uniref:hypothetical protein n=1 Tax=Breoghania corrubedonensis TaxID=665038 RepID=UPI0011B24B1B|nr:hypothetical protein [Breoghania corrubedonensis]
MTSILACGGPLGSACAGTPYDEFEERPAEFFCMMSHASRGEVCVRLYLDEDGYELCLSDEVAKTERCMSNYRQPEDQDEEYDYPGNSAVRLINC